MFLSPLLFPSLSSFIVTYINKFYIVMKFLSCCVGWCLTEDIISQHIPVFTRFLLPFSNNAVQPSVINVVSERHFRTSVGQSKHRQLGETDRETPALFTSRSTSRPACPTKMPSRYHDRNRNFWGNTCRHHVLFSVVV